MEINKVKKGKGILKTDGRLRFFFLGVGSAFTKKHFQTNLLVIKGDDHLLIDCGTRCTQSLYTQELSITDIHNFLITHSHADHIGGLEEAALMARYVKKMKPMMIIDETYQHILWDMSMRGGCAYNEEEAGDILTFKDFWEVIQPKHLPEYPRQTFGSNCGGIKIKMMRTKHIPDSTDNWANSFWSCGVIIDDKAMYTSDTRFDPDLVTYYDEKLELETIFHDCQFFTGGVHASLEELKTLPDNIKAKMYLVHYGDNWEQFEEKVKEYGFAGLARQHTGYDFF